MPTPNQWTRFEKSRAWLHTRRYHSMYPQDWHWLYDNKRNPRPGLPDPMFGQNMERYVFDDGSVIVCAGEEWHPGIHSQNMLPARKMVAQLRKDDPKLPVYDPPWLWPQDHDAFRCISPDNWLSLCDLDDIQNIADLTLSAFADGVPFMQSLFPALCDFDRHVDYEGRLVALLVRLAFEKRYGCDGGGHFDAEDEFRLIDRWSASYEPAIDDHHFVQDFVSASFDNLESLDI